MLFTIRGLPYSIDQYPQFQAMYSKTYVPDQLFMCGRQISKSTNLSRSEVYNSIQIPNFQTLYVAPLQSQSHRYSLLYLGESIKTCRQARILQDKSNEGKFGTKKGAALSKAVMHQSFLNGAGIQMTYAKTSSDRARGITADCIDFDEIQDQLTDHIPVISESISNSPFGGMRRFTGTAKTTDNTIESLWQQSSKGEWAVKCKACRYWNIPDREHNVIDMIGPLGPICGKCGKSIEPREGGWVHGYPDRCTEFLGHHIPQIFVPAIYEDPIKWNRLTTKVTKLPPSIIYTEILGISSDVGARLITQNDIDEVSVLGTHKELAAKLDNYVCLALGVDWGIAEITSFTVATVVGITRSGTIHVLYARRFVGMDIEDVVHEIARLARLYRCHYVAPDFGVGYLNNAMLRNKGLQVVQVMYVKANKFLSPKEMNGNMLWTVDRNTALGLLFYNIKQKRILFPNKDDSQSYTADLLSPFEELVEQSSGVKTKKFLRDPNKPDDFCHALVFAMMVLYYRTNHSALQLSPQGSMGTENFDFLDNEQAIDVEAIIQMMNSL